MVLFCTFYQNPKWHVDWPVALAHQQRALCGRHCYIASFSNSILPLIWMCCHRSRRCHTWTNSLLSVSFFVSAFVHYIFFHSCSTDSLHAMTLSSNCDTLKSLKVDNPKGELMKFDQPQKCLNWGGVPHLDFGHIAWPKTALKWPLWPTFFGPDAKGAIFGWVKGTVSRL